MEDPSVIRARALDLEERFISLYASVRADLSEDELANYKNTFRILFGRRSQFKYEPLNRETKEIRIIVLQPSKDISAEPVCEIYHVPLESAEYFAFSYVWGDSEDTRPISLDGKILRVTANLELALRQVRHEENPIPFWIDAICINQEDVEERNYQVGQMREIYANALLVLAWIGPQLSDREEKAFDLLLQIAEHFAKDKALVTDETSAWIADSVSSEFQNCSWLPLLELLERPWFSRVWVVQEVVVSKKVTIQCGTVRLSHETLMLALLAVSAYLTTIAEASGRDITDADHVTQPGRIHELGKINDRLGVATSHVKIIHQSQYEKQRHLPRPESSYDIVYRYNGKQATDPRDKIYALLGLADESHEEVPRIIPDYTNEPRDIFLNAIRLHIEIHRDLKPLFECCGPDRPDGFPSWMPHWNPRYNPNVMRSLQVGDEIKFKASGDSKVSVNPSLDPLVLSLKGILVDIIQAVGAQHEARPGEMLGDEPYMPDAVWQSWTDIIGMGDLFRYPGQFDKMSTEDKAVASSDYIRGDIDKYHAFWRTLVMNPHSDFDIDYWSSSSGKKTSSAPKLDEDGLSRYRMSARSDRCCGNRRFFLTKQGYMGLSFPDIRVGDLVCVFLGLELPFIVRLEEKAFSVVLQGLMSYTVPPQFSLVGEAYVQGLMDGEAMQDLDAGFVELTDFELR
jgi:hypothetical protein